MKAVFVELPPFERHRADYLSEENFRELQQQLMNNPEAGDLMKGTGGLRKIRFQDEKRSKGKRGGIRIIYFWWQQGKQFWLFTLYDKNELDDLTNQQKIVIRKLLEIEISLRKVS